MIVLKEVWEMEYLLKGKWIKLTMRFTEVMDKTSIHLRDIPNLRRNAKFITFII
jgi:hypothetical protein